MKYRKLRIAWSVAWGIACLLLIMLWVRSHSWAEVCTKPLSVLQHLIFASSQGWATIRLNNGPANIPIQVFPPPPIWRQYWIQRQSRAEIEKTNEEIRRMGGTPVPPNYKIGFTGDGAVRSPYWLSVLVFAVIAAAPWLRNRFSLRTLLIAMTVAAIGLGWIVYAIRK